MGYVDYQGPNLDEYLVGRSRTWVTYAEGAMLYGIPYYTFVHIVNHSQVSRHNPIVRYH